MKVPFFSLEHTNNLIRKEITQAFSEVFEKGIYCAGPKVKELEEKWSEYNKCKYCVAVANGTVALELVVKYFYKHLPSKSVHYIHTTPNSFVATTESIVLNFCNPAFKDTDNTGNLSIDQLFEETWYADSLANNDIVLGVSLYGNPFDLNKLKEGCDKRGVKKIYTIVDNAQAAGCLLNGQHLEELADVVTYSLFPTKPLATFGEGGLICTNNQELAKFARTYIQHGQQEKNIHSIVGNNGRMSEWQAAFALINLKYLDVYLEDRNRAAKRYMENLGGCGKIKFIEIDKRNFCSFYVFPVYVANRHELHNRLLERNINTAFHYTQSIHLQPAYSYLGYRKNDFPNAEKQFEEEISLPIFYGITDSQIDLVSESVLKVFL